ncbi:MAG: hypothetical protein IPF71_15560 [Rhodoferax sp.]|nr:hypothetical protein [Rhodoferax sp.]
MLAVNSQEGQHRDVCRRSISINCSFAMLLQRSLRTLSQHAGGRFHSDGRRRWNVSFCEVKLVSVSLPEKAALTWGSVDSSSAISKEVSCKTFTQFGIERVAQLIVGIFFGRAT